MRCPNSKSRCAIPKVLLLLGLLGLLGSLALSPAWADSPVPHQKGLSVQTGGMAPHALYSPATSLLSFEALEANEQPAHRFEDQHSRADLYTLARLAVEEMEFLAGIRVLWHKTERRVDRWVVRLKLKGDISLGQKNNPPGSTDPGSPSMPIHSFARRPDVSHSTLSLRSIFIPEKIRWNFGFDPNDQVVFGTLKWGSYLALQSDVGSRQEVKMIFQYTF